MQTGILTIGNTEWDGSLGEAENHALRMVGFLFKGVKALQQIPLILCESFTCCALWTRVSERLTLVCWASIPLGCNPKATRSIPNLHLLSCQPLCSISTALPVVEPDEG